MCLVCFHFKTFRFHRLTEQSQMLTNHTIVHSELHQENKMPNSNRIGMSKLYIPYILSTSMNIREGVFEIKKMVMLIIILENLLINEVICLILISTLHVLCDIDYNKKMLS